MVFVNFLEAGAKSKFGGSCLKPAPRDYMSGHHITLFSTTFYFLKLQEKKGFRGQ